MGKHLIYFQNQMYPKEPGKADGTETTANLNQKLFYHVLGTPQDKDILCAEFPDNAKWLRYVVYFSNDLFHCIYHSLFRGVLPVQRPIVNLFAFGFEYFALQN